MSWPAWAARRRGVAATTSRSRRKWESERTWFIRDVRASSVRVVVSDGDVSLAGEQFSIPDFVAERLRPGEARLVLEVEVISSVAITLEGVLP